MEEVSKDSNHDEYMKRETARYHTDTFSLFIFLSLVYINDIHQYNQLSLNVLYFNEFVNRWDRSGYPKNLMYPDLDSDIPDSNSDMPDPIYLNIHFNISNIIINKLNINIF